ncbi:MAG: hypothetical protein IKG85_06895 [Clostridia bacterium]|nr:hypothetical protein [Clostridia bacterium]
MNKERMLEAIGDIDPAFIREAAPKRRSRFMPYLGAAAAALVLVFGLALILPKLLKPSAEQPKGNSSAQAPTVTAGSQTEPSDDTPSGVAALPTGFAPALPGDSYGSPGFPEAMPDELAQGLRELADSAEFIALADNDGANGEKPVYTLVGSIKGDLPEEFIVTDGVTDHGAARLLLFLKSGVNGEYGLIAAMLEGENGTAAANMPEGSLDAGCGAVTEFVREYAGNRN